MLPSTGLFDTVLTKLVSLRTFLPDSMQKTIPSYNHSERATIIAAVRLLHGQGYPVYTPEMTLPAGVYPPMDGFMHADLLKTVAVAIQVVLVRRGVSQRMEDDLIAQINDLVRSEMETQGVEYQLSNFCNRDYKYRVSRTNTLYVLADECRDMTRDVVSNFVHGDTELASRLTVSVREQIIQSTSNAMRNHLLQLLYR